jgi:hypothetical protein
MDIALQGIQILSVMFTNLKNRNLTLIFVVVFCNFDFVYRVFRFF